MRRAAAVPKIGAKSQTGSCRVGSLPPASNQSNQVLTGSNAYASTQRSLGWSNRVRVTQIVLQGQLAKKREREHKINTLL
jgi:hypothetical protein